jgi:hypothetical protein
MRRATGPGTVDEIPTPAGAPFPGAAVSLSNFDFDDATVKVEHANWLRQQAAPRLAAGAKVFLRGTASRVGDRNYNLQLSKRRVDAVKDFLVQNGVSAGQVVTTFTGEDLSTSKSPDDPKDRAVLAVFDFPPTTRVAFDHGVRGDRLDGFDDRPTPPTQVVPVEGPVRVRLVGGPGALLESANTGVVRVQNPRDPGRTPVFAAAADFAFQLQPVLEGSTEVFARNVAGRVVARLAVTVLANKAVTVTFHYMKGTIATARKPDAKKEEGFIAVMNGIYTRQANITFTRKGNDTPTEPKVVGPEVRSDLHLGGDWKPIVAHRNGARFNVFFVKVLEIDGDTKTDTVDALTQIGGDRDCIFEDPDANDPGDSNDGETLAHEAGHAFGADDDNPHRQNLMFGTTHRRGRLIPAAIAAGMNANLRKKP